MNDNPYTGSMEPKEKLVWVVWFVGIGMGSVLLYLLNNLAIAAQLPNHL